MLSNGGDAGQVRRIAEGFQIRWEPIENPAIKKQLLAGDSYYYTTWSTCDCMTSLGSGRPDTQRPRNHDRKVAQLRKQGWSAAKIERSLADREAVATRKARAKAEQGAIPGPDADRWGELVALLDDNHPHHAEHDYLWFAAVRPAWQGRGYGSALLRAVLDRADRTGTPAYLDATSPDNRRLYERHGFRVIGELAVAGGPRVWQMWREP